MRKLTLMALSSLMTISVSFNAQAESSKADGVDALAPQLLKKHDVPSVAVAYIEDGKLAFTRIYGEQSWGKEADSSTLYNVASLTKPVVAEALLRMVDEGDISLKTKLADFHVEEDVADHKWTPLLTPELVLRHETGFTNWRYQTDWTLTFQRQPGTEVGYSGEGYEWLAKAMAKATESDFEALVEHYVFTPAEMKRTAFTFKNWFVGHTAAPYKKGEGVFDMIHWNNYSAADDMRTTISDYAKFMLYAFEKPVSEALQQKRVTITRQHNPYLNCYPPTEAKDFCPDRAGWGLGWMVMEWNGEKVLHHTGGDHGENTIAFYLPSKKQGGIIFTNGANGHKLFGPIIQELIEHPDFIKTIELTN